jgi:hypothetical protein
LEISVGQSVREDVLARYGTPDQIILQEDEVWLYDGRNTHDSYIDVAMRIQAAMAMATTTRPATNPAIEARNRAMLDAMTSLAQMNVRRNGGLREPSKFAFDRKTGRLRSLSGPPPSISYGNASKEAPMR